MQMFFWGGEIVSIALAYFTNLHSEIVNQMLRTSPHATAIPKTAHYSAIARTAISCGALTFFIAHDYNKGLFSESILFNNQYSQLY